MHLANGKSVSNKFRGFYYPPYSEKRNSDIVGDEEREKTLVIDSGSISIKGTNHSGDNYRFDKGQCFGVKVPLGEIQTDEKGRLVVLGGFGRSDCKDGDRINHPLNNFADNNWWFDDTSDGPVTASVILENGTAYLSKIMHG